MKSKNNRIWWLLSAIGLFIVTKGKTIFTLLKGAKFAAPMISMFVTIGAYAFLFPLGFAIGLVIMILIHETGHVLAAKQKGLPVSAPLFIPFIGALITMKRHPRDAVTEAYIAFGGPILGTVGALLSLWIGVTWQIDLLIVIAYVGFFINLLNLLPIHPLDGGRISTAVTRWLWLIGLVGGLVVIIQLRAVLFFIIWALFAWELYNKYVRKSTKGRERMESVGFEAPYENLQGIILPGKEHQLSLPFETYSNLEGQQKVIIHWDAIGIHDTVYLPQQGVIYEVVITRVERNPKQLDKLIISCLIKYDIHENEAYYDVPIAVRWRYGLLYAGLAIFLLYMMNFTQQLDISTF